MELSHAARHALGVATAVALFTGCNAGASGVGQQIAPASDASSIRHRPVSLIRPDVPLLHRRVVALHPARVNPNCCARLLFVSDPGASAVQVYDVATGAYHMTLSPSAGFSKPEGECVDTPNPQHVFVTDAGASTILEFRHNGTQLSTLADPGEQPVSCSYRSTGPNSGVLAVGNVTTSPVGGLGSVSVYTRTGNTWNGPVTYFPPGFSVFFVSYQNSTLYLDGLYSLSFFGFESMSPSGAFTQIPVAAQINYPGGVQAMPNYIAVGDQAPPAGSPNIYHVLPNGQVVGSTTFSPSPGDMVQFFRRGPRIAVPDAAGTTSDIYSYSPPSYINTQIGPLVQPVGSAISYQ